MKINQLFKSHIPEDLFIRILNCFGFLNINDEHSFCKVDLAKMSTVEKLFNITDEISKYYLPCKAKLYLGNLDENKAITILRQVLRLHSMTLISKQKYIKQKKTTLYSIQKKSDEEKPISNIKIDNEKKVIQFL
jgi:hypothetical protein